MKIKSKLLIGAVLAVGLTVVTVAPANADMIFGDRSCGAPRLAGTSSTASSGSVLHVHTDLNGGGTLSKSWTNTGVQTRYWSWKEDITFRLTSGGTTTAYSATCDL